MRSHFRNNVVGYLALVVALSGTSYAAVQLSAGQVQTKHLADGAVTGKKVRNHSIASRDLKVGVVKNWKVLVASTRAGNAGAGTPAAQPDFMSAGPVTFVMPRQGRVYLRYFNSEFWGECAASSLFAGMYVDGEPVPGTQSNLAQVDNADNSIDLVGTLLLSKGTHQVNVGRDCPTSTMQSSTSDANPTWTILKVG